MIRFIVSLSLLAAASVPAFAGSDAAALFQDHCSACHAPTRLGGTGPALIPESLGRIKPDALNAVIAKGRAATQMPGFGETLSKDDIAALAAYVMTPLADVPGWSTADIAATRTLNPAYKQAAKPVFTGDPLNVTLVVETGDHHISVLDGDSFAVLDRYPTPYAVHGGPSSAPTGASSSSCRAMAGYRNTISGPCRRWAACAPG